MYLWLLCNRNCVWMYNFSSMSLFKVHLWYSISSLWPEPSAMPVSLFPTRWLVQGHRMLKRLLNWRRQWHLVLDLVVKCRQVQLATNIILCRPITSWILVGSMSWCILPFKNSQRLRIFFTCRIARTMGRKCILLIGSPFFVRSTHVYFSLNQKKKKAWRCWNAIKNLPFYFLKRRP